jgi:hypothetical protein
MQPEILAVRGSLPWIRDATGSTLLENGGISVYGVNRGPACILEGLSEALARLVSDRAISRTSREHIIALEARGKG